MCTRVRTGLGKTCLQCLHRGQDPSVGFGEYEAEEIREIRSNEVFVCRVFWRGAERLREGAPVWLRLNNTL